MGGDHSFLTAIGNDYGYENVFTREIKSSVNSCYIVIAITTSVNSQNILKVSCIKNNGILALMFTGRRLRKLSNYCAVFKMPLDHISSIQECHILIGHILCEIIEDKISGDDKN